jgi:hypothetical protein
MAYLKDLIPELMDEVRHRINPEGTGVVIAKYPSVRAGEEGVIVLDVRSDTDFIYYGTPAANWEVTKLNDELEGI